MPTELGLLRRVAAGLLLAGFAAAFAIAIGTSPAAAHAVLLSTTPVADQILAAGPSQVELRFDERVDASLGSVKVTRPDGRRADRGRVSSHDAGRTVVVAVDADSVGTYIVSWRVVSVDNHPLSGSFLFSVGTRTEAAGERSGVDGGSSGRVLSATGRFTAYATTLASLGMLVARRRALPLDGVEPRLTRAIAVVAGIGVLAVLLGLVGQVSQASGRTPLSSIALLPETVTTTRLGVAALVRLTGGVALLIAALFLHRSRLSEPVAVGGGAVALLVPSFVGHATTAPLAAAAVAVDSLHLVGASLWVGGLAALAIAGRGARPLAQQVSHLAAPAAAVVAVTGLASAWLQARSVAALTDTSWGRLIGLKAAGFVGLIVLGYVSRSRLLPVATRFRALVRAVKLELVIVAAVLVVTTLVTNRPPARTEHTRPITVDIPAADGGNLTLTVSPARVGTNEIHLYFLDPAGLQRPVDAVEATVAVGDVPPRKIRLTPITASHYADYGLVLPSPGRWVVTVTNVSRGQPETQRLEIPVR